MYKQLTMEARLWKSPCAWPISVDFLRMTGGFTRQRDVLMQLHPLVTAGSVTFDMYEIQKISGS